MCSTPGFLLYTSTDAFPPKVFWGGGEANAARKAIWSRVRGRGACMHHGGAASTVRLLSNYASASAHVRSYIVYQYLSGIHDQLKHL